MFGWHGNIPCDGHSAVTGSRLHGHVPGFHGAHAGAGKTTNEAELLLGLAYSVLLCSHHRVCLTQDFSIPVLATRCSAQFVHCPASKTPASGQLIIN